MRTITLNQPRRLVFGCGSIADCITYLRELAPEHLRVITSPFLLEAAATIHNGLTTTPTEVSVDSSILGEPTVEDTLAAIESASTAGATCILGIGGGSVLDVAKLVAAFVTGEQQLHETFGIGLLRSRSCHLVCMPTTSGTGSEVSPNAILLDETVKLKKAVISPYLMPDAAFIDPELTVTVPPTVTASTGLDALAHCLEAYTNKFAHPIVDTYALEGVALAGRFLLRAVRDPNDMEAREGMALASLYGGLCLGPVNTAAGHALAYPLGSEYHIPHGVSVALVQPHVFRFNAEATPEKHAAVAKALGVQATGSHIARAQAGAGFLANLTRESGIKPNLADHGVRPEDISNLADSALKVERLLRNSARTVTKDDCIAIYRTCFDAH
jgi:alcohol dehydrogenase class IV